MVHEDMQNLTEVELDAIVVNKEPVSRAERVVQCRFLR